MLRSASPLDSLARADVPRVIVDLGGLDLARTGVAVLRVEVRHELGRPSSVAVDTADLDAEQLEIVDDGRVKEGGPIAVDMGLGDAIAAAFVGEITGLDLELSPDEAARAAIRGHDRLHRLARARKTRAFVEQTDSQIAATIAQEHGLSADATDSRLVRPYVLQREQTDLAFLLARARGLGYVVRLEDRTLHFRPRGLAGSPIARATLGVSLLSLQASTSVLGQVGAVEARGWDPAAQAAVVVEVPESKLASRMGGRTSGLKLADACFARETTAAAAAPHLSADAAELAAAAELEAMALGHVVCRGRMLGAAALRPGVLLTVDGFRGRFAGDYFLTRVVHTYDRDGFVTEFEGRRTAT